MYKGDELLAIGTRKEICKKMNIKHQTFQYYRSKEYQKRLENRKARNYRTIIKIEK